MPSSATGISSTVTPLATTLTSAATSSTITTTATAPFSTPTPLSSTISSVATTMSSSSAAALSSTTTPSSTTAHLITITSSSTTPSSTTTPLTTTTASSPSSSAVPISSSDKEKTNHFRLSRLLTDIGRRVLQNVLDSLHPPPTLHAFLNSWHVYSQLNGLKSRRVLHSEQWDKLYPPAGVTVSSGNFDITLLFLLLRSVCGLAPPTTGWDKAPLATDLSMEADLVRIKRCRNDLYAHRVEMAMSDKEFHSNWLEIEAALVRLGGASYKADIQHLLSASMDPEQEKLFKALLCKAWEESEDTVRWTDLTQRDYIILVAVIAFVSPVVAHHLTDVLSQGFVIFIALVIVGIVLYQLYMPGSWYRYRECNKGSIEGGSEVWFTYTTFTKQTPRVHGVEFEWETLKKKLNLPFDKHEDPGMRYYLNIDRCAYGGVVPVKSSLPWDRTPQVCGAEVFAVDSTCSHAYYEMEGKWHVYVSGRDFKSIPPYN